MAPADHSEHEAPGSGASLAGLGIVVTRASHQAEGLCARIEAAAGHAYRFPLLEIVEPRDSAGLSGRLEALAAYDLAIFVSANAVERGLAKIQEHGGLPVGLKIAAIGQPTAASLRARNVPVDLAPTAGFTSEALLALAEMRAVRGRRIVIVRGEGGREHLVDYAEVYRRVGAQSEAHGLERERARGRIQLLTVNSPDALDQLAALTKPAASATLRRVPLLVGSERTATHARGCDFESVLAASDPSDAAMFGAIERWARSRRFPGLV